MILPKQILLSKSAKAFITELLSSKVTNPLPKLLPSLLNIFNSLIIPKGLKIYSNSSSYILNGKFVT